MDEIISKIDNILKIYETQITEHESIKKIEDNLFRISWRSSEIPSVIRFGIDSPLTERSWIILDYLSNSLVQIQDNCNIKQELFQNLKDGLSVLKFALKKDKVKRKKIKQNFLQ